VYNQHGRIVRDERGGDLTRGCEDVFWVEELVEEMRGEGEELEFID
jgi:hypothetical protein